MDAASFLLVFFFIAFVYCFLTEILWFTVLLLTISHACYPDSTLNTSVSPPYPKDPKTTPSEIQVSCSQRGSFIPELHPRC